MLGTRQTSGLTAYVASGRGQRLVLGAMDHAGNDSIEVAISWVSVFIRQLRDLGGVPGEEGRSLSLYLHDEDVVVRASDLGQGKRGPSAGACVALALVQWLWRHRPFKRDVGVTGVLNLRGQLLPVEAVVEKAKAAKADKVSTFILPAIQYDHYKRDDFAVVPEELRAYAKAAFRPASTMLDVLTHAFQGRRLKARLSQEQQYTHKRVLGRTGQDRRHNLLTRPPSLSLLSCPLMIIGFSADMSIGDWMVGSSLVGIGRAYDPDIGKVSGCLYQQT